MVSTPYQAINDTHPLPPRAHCGSGHSNDRFWSVPVLRKGRADDVRVRKWQRTYNMPVLGH